MRNILISELKPGMKLSKNVFSDKGRLILTESTILKNSHITRLNFFGVEKVSVEDDFYRYQIEKDEEIYNVTFDAIKGIMSQAIHSKRLDEKLIAKNVSSIVSYVLEDDNAFMHLTGIRDKDNYTFLHSIDVCIFAIITGKTLNLSQDELLTLGTASLLHDIGKCKVPDYILLKPGVLTKEEFEIIKKHTIDGHEIIKEKTNHSELIAKIILQHHERWDGTGYPFGLKSTDIHLFSRIVTISDIYDALTADRIYRKKALPHEAAEFIVGNSSRILDPEIVKAFIQNIAIYPIGSKIVLNTGEIAEVIKVNKSLPYRPTIRIFSHKDETTPVEPHDLDLIKARNIFITDLV